MKLTAKRFIREGMAGHCDQASFAALL
jgi:hypothetical protein